MNRPWSLLIVVDRGIEPLCQDWESCILTIRWIDQRCNFELSLRKVGDSNPRYGNPHVSLANWWFQPLTQPSNRILLPNQQASFSNAGAKILHFFCSTKFFCNFFQEICIFLWFFLFLRGIIGDKQPLSIKKGRFTNYWKSASCRKGSLDDVMKLRMS